MQSNTIIAKETGIVSTKRASKNLTRGMMKAKRHRMPLVLDRVRGTKEVVVTGSAKSAKVVFV